MPNITDYAEGKQVVGVVEGHPINSQNACQYILTSALAGGTVRDVITVFKPDVSGVSRKLLQRIFNSTDGNTTIIYPESDVTGNGAYAAQVFVTYP